MYRASIRTTPEDPTIPNRPGWEGLHVWWLVTRERGGSTEALFNVSEFPPHRRHEVHAHPGAEEFFFVLEGGGLHLTEHDEHELEVGDVVFVEKGEWHGFHNNRDEVCRVVSVFGGVSMYEDGGYVVLGE